MLSRWLARPDHAATARLDALEAATGALASRLATMERAEATRAAEHAAMLDRLDRLYKRVSARISREGNGHTSEPGESPLALRQRLRGGL